MFRMRLVAPARIGCKPRTIDDIRLGSTNLIERRLDAPFGLVLLSAPRCHPLDWSRKLESADGYNGRRRSVPDTRWLFLATLSVPAAGDGLGPGRAGPAAGEVRVGRRRDAGSRAGQQEATRPTKSIRLCISTPVAGAGGLSAAE